MGFRLTCGLGYRVSDAGFKMLGLTLSFMGLVLPARLICSLVRGGLEDCLHRFQGCRSLQHICI